MKNFILFLAVTVFSLFAILFVGSQSAFAKTPRPTSTPVPTPSSAAAPAGVNSFELFWPLAAGKTEDEPLYFLKQLKEKFRGLLIFGTPQKLDYNVLLATKRVLEAEKLIKEGKTDVAKRTLGRAEAQLDKVEKNINDAKSSNQSLAEVSQVASSRLSNIQKLTAWLATKNSELKDMLIEVGNKAGSLSSKF